MNQVEYRQDGRSDEKSEKDLMSGQALEYKTAFSLVVLFNKILNKEVFSIVKMTNDKNQGFVKKDISNEGDCVFSILKDGITHTCVAEIKTNPTNFEGHGYSSKSPNSSSEKRIILKKDSILNCIKNNRPMILCRKDFYGKFYLEFLSCNDLENIYNSSKFVPWREVSPKINSDKMVTELFYDKYNFVETKSMTVSDVNRMIGKLIK